MKALLIACHAVAISSTCFRLAHRIIKRRVWFDDLWAMFALISDFFLLIIYLTLPVTSYGKHYLSLSWGHCWLQLDWNTVRIPLVLQQFSRITTLISYTCVLWYGSASVINHPSNDFAIRGSRISVAVTIVRLVNRGTFRRLAKAASIVFVLVCICLIIQKFFMCRDRSAKALVWCPISPATGILELSS